MRFSCASATAAAVLAILVNGCRPADRASTAVSPAVVTVHARDFSFEAPSSVQSGPTTFRMINDGAAFHHAQIVRLDSMKTMADLQKALETPGPLPKWAAFVGGPNAVDPGREGNATLNLTPGQYVLLCFVDVPGGVPHFAKGMVLPLTVTESSAPQATMPTADVVMTLSDYKFELSKPLAAGGHTFEVRNNSDQPHEVELIQLAPGKTDTDMLGWIQKPEGPPPGHGLGGVAAFARDHTVYFTADLTPGNYLLMCFVPDAKDGKPHFAHGMLQVIAVS